jgi:transcriptional regulator with XRE-family HTH domain
MSYEKTPVAALVAAFGIKAATMSTFQERVKKLASSVGGAQVLADKSGLSRRTIGSYMAGDTDPKRADLVALASAGNVTVDWLAVGAGEMHARLAAHAVEQAAPQYGGDYVGEDFLTTVIQAMESALAGEKSLSPRQKARLISEAVKLCRSMDVEHHPERFKPIIDALLAVMVDNDG